LADVVGTLVTDFIFMEFVSLQQTRVSVQFVWRQQQQQQLSLQNIRTAFVTAR
jgi:hypothetical protein